MSKLKNQSARYGTGVKTSVLSVWASNFSLPRSSLAPWIFAGPSAERQVVGSLLHGVDTVPLCRFFRGDGGHRGEQGAGVMRGAGSRGNASPPVSVQKTAQRHTTAAAPTAAAPNHGKRPRQRLGKSAGGFVTDPPAPSPPRQTPPRIIRWR
jgi:hypothetical protein